MRNPVVILEDSLKDSYKVHLYTSYEDSEETFYFPICSGEHDHIHNHYVISNEIVQAFLLHLTLLIGPNMSSDQNQHS